MSPHLSGKYPRGEDSIAELCAATSDGMSSEPLLPPSGGLLAGRDPKNHPAIPRFLNSASSTQISYRRFPFSMLIKHRRAMMVRLPCAGERIVCAGCTSDGSELPMADSRSRPKFPFTKRSDKTASRSGSTGAETLGEP